MPNHRRSEMKKLVAAQKNMTKKNQELVFVKFLFSLDGM
jgi:hypothetical protein